MPDMQPSKMRDDTTLTEKVEGLFNLRVSSSGASTGILFDGMDESMRVWLDGDTFIRFRQSIEQLVTEGRIEELKGIRYEDNGYGILAKGDEPLMERIATLEAELRNGEKG